MWNKPWGTTSIFFLLFLFNFSGYKFECKCKKSFFSRFKSRDYVNFNSDYSRSWWLWTYWLEQNCFIFSGCWRKLANWSFGKKLSLVHNLAVHYCQVWLCQSNLFSDFVMSFLFNHQILIVNLAHAICVLVPFLWAWKIHCRLYFPWMKKGKYIFLTN